MEHSKTIIFVHGMFNNNLAWKNWQSYFNGLGYSTFALNWPFHEGEAASLRSSPDPRLAIESFSSVFTSLKSEISRIDSSAILVGHSMGGLLVQKLIDSGIGSAGICISSAPPPGVIVFDLNMIKSALPLLNLLAINQPFVMTRRQFYFSFCNTLSKSESDTNYESFLVPESRRIALTAAGPSAQIDLKKSHPPLLFLAGQSDRFIPWKLNQKNAAAYTCKDSVVKFKCFENRGHFICGEPGWEEVANAAENFLDRLK